MKEKTVKIAGKDVKLSTSGYLVILYSDLFGTNVFEDFGRIIDAVQKSKDKETATIPYSEMTTLYKLCYAMAKHSDPDLIPFVDWLKETDPYEIPMLSDDILSLWRDETSTQSTP